MKWFEISEELYFTIYNHCQGRFQVFSSCTLLENTSAYDAGILTEWGFKGATAPLIKLTAEPKSQANVPKNVQEWPHKYYINTFQQENEE